MNPDMSLVDVKVECGAVYRYKAHQIINEQGKRAYEIQDGDVLSDLHLPDVKPPCACPVVQVYCR